ncbi:MAG: 4-hydroxythreonine-4-phosphate dehydrogenase PdxA [Chlorobiota bacterium]
MKLNVAVSVGDLNGLGLECFVKSLFKLNAPNIQIEFSLFAPKNLVIDYLNKLEFDYNQDGNRIIINDIIISIEGENQDSNINWGKLDGAIGHIAAESIYNAVVSVKSKESDILLTLPINKKSISLSGFKFPGHTEMLGDSFGSDPLMILFSSTVRVALVTVHEPISKVSNLISEKLIEQKYASFELSLRKDFGIKKPKIAILGLNPHAGEEGNIGSEEKLKINPLISQLNDKYRHSEAFGTFPADGFFGFGDYANYDGILAMYHDQGLIPLKLLANGGGVNFTANLDIVRVSPDHGTGFNIAGRGMASEESTLEAIIEGLKIYKNRVSF